MAVNGNFFKLYNMVGNYRSFLLSRISSPMYQPLATLKQSLEEIVGMPPKPKKPLTPYLVFTKQVRPGIVEKSPGLKMIDITKLVAQRWHETEQKVKEKMQEDYRKKREQYLKDKENYNELITDEQRARLEAAKADIKVSKEKKLHAKALKSLGKPKRPMIATARWFKTLHEKRGTMPLSEWQKKMTARWAALPAAERSVYELEATKEMEEYKIEMKKWEQKMIELGNHDLIKYGVKTIRKKSVNKNDHAE